MSSASKHRLAIFIVALSFFIFMLIIFVNSFPADYRIATNDIGRFLSTGSLMPLFHLASELIGEVGVILRFIGACFFLAFAYSLIKKKSIFWSRLKKAVLLEGTYYLFNIVFIIYLIIRAVTSVDASSAAILSYYGAATSYAAQTIFVSPIFLIFYRKLRSDGVDGSEIAKWSALAITSFIFGLWIKHFMLAIYAVGLDFSSINLVIGSLNSVFTLLLAGIVSVVALMPLYKKTGTKYSSKGLGLAFILAGLYSAIFFVISLINEQYMNWLSLVDWWAIAFIILGLSFFINRKE